MTYQIGVIQLPGSNCERETKLALQRAQLTPIDIFWFDHANKLIQCDGFVIVGGFSYEDRCRSGAIAALDPIIQALITEAKKGKPILGICNGAQILVESGLVPGCVNTQDQLTPVIALAHNKREHPTGFYNAWCDIKSKNSPNLHILLAHAEGRFMVPNSVDALLKSENVITWHYVNDNPNGSHDQLAGIANFSGNILALMPHPERTSNGDYIFDCMRRYIEEKKPFQWVTKLSPNNTYAYKQLSLSEFTQTYFVKLNITDNEAISVEVAFAQHDIAVSVRKYEFWGINTDHNSLEQIEQSYVLWNTQKQIVKKTLPNKENTIYLIVSNKDDMTAPHKKQVLTSHYGIADTAQITHATIWELSGEQTEIEAALQSSLLVNPISQQAFLLDTSNQTVTNHETKVAAL